MWLVWHELLLVDLCCPIVEELVALPEEGVVAIGQGVKQQQNQEWASGVELRSCCLSTHKRG